MGRKFDEVQEEIGKGVASVFGFVGFDSPTAFAPCFFFSSWRNAIPPDDTMTCTSVFRAALVELLRAKNRGGSPSLASTERGTRWTAAQPKFVTEKEETHDNCN